MAEPDDDVLHKLDALLRRHQPTDPDIPVLTDVVVPSPLDLESIPVLTEEIGPGTAGGEVPALEALPPPGPPPSAGEGPASAAARVSTGHGGQARAQVPVEARPLEFEWPPDARYIALDLEPSSPGAQPAPSPPEPAAEEASPRLPALSEETVRLIAETIKADVAGMLDARLQEAFGRQLQASLHGALDRALSSMLDQFVVHIEEVVRVTIASELEKQLAGLRRPEA